MVRNLLIDKELKQIHEASYFLPNPDYWIYGVWGLFIWRKFKNKKPS